MFINERKGFREVFGNVIGRRVVRRDVEVVSEFIAVGQVPLAGDRDDGLDIAS
jgi:hypothetical protein